MDRLDFRTTVGWAEGGTSRKALGAPGGGPTRVITDLGVYGFEEETREMTLESVHPGVTLEQVRGATGWDLKVSPSLGATETPDGAMLRLLREELDPDRIYLKG